MEVIVTGFYNSFNRHTFRCILLTSLAVAANYDTSLFRSAEFAASLSGHQNINSSYLTIVENRKIVRTGLN
jgi:hypothetical protein